MSHFPNSSKITNKNKGTKLDHVVNAAGGLVENRQNDFRNNQSFISIHSTDNPCIVEQATTDLDEENCNVEILSVNNIFPSTSEESLSVPDDMIAKSKLLTQPSPKSSAESCAKYAPSNSKSSTVPTRKKDVITTQMCGFSDYDIPKGTMYVMGSNPGEPKINYPDPPKKISKTMKKFLRNMDKQKAEVGLKMSEKTMNTRGILKDSRCTPECNGDSETHSESHLINEPMDCTLDYEQPPYNTKSIQDKNVTFNTQVVIIHLRGELCVGQSVDALSKEKDQQARNSELRRTYLSKYNEFWPTQKLKH